MLQQEQYQQFRDKTLKVKGKRHHEITNSIGIPYIYSKLYKTGNIKCPINKFRDIIKAVNKELANDLLDGLDVKLPYSLGIIETRKYDAKVSLVDGKIKTNRPIDWSETLKLWFEDEESKRNKVLVRLNEKQMVKIRYNKSTAKYNNKAFFEFKFCRDLKLKLKEAIKNNKFDTFKI